MDDFLTTPWGNWFNGGFQPKSTNVPSVNISERKEDYLVSMAAPGLKKEDFKIAVEGNLLSICSEREESKKAEDERYTRKEYSYSFIERSFTLPEDVKKDKIDAKYKDGVLEVVLLKKEEAKKIVISKKITVK